MARHDAGLHGREQRTALVTALYFLEKNGWDVAFNDNLMFVVAIAVAKGDLDRDALADILRTHMVPLDGSGGA